MSDFNKIKLRFKYFGQELFKNRLILNNKYKGNRKKISEQ